MENKPRVIIAGGSGLIGRALAEFLSRRNFDVVVLTRGKEGRCGEIRYVRWDGKKTGAWKREVDGSAAIVDLAGRSINCRFTDGNRKQILDSRVDSTHALAGAVGESAAPPRVFIQASGIGYYANSRDRIVDENAAIGSDFMAEVCRQWEGALNESAFRATRKVILRIGIVLARDGGALSVLERLTSAYLGGAAGNGRQFVSWIHIHDIIRIIAAAIERDDLSGIFNATAPHPVTNAELMSELRCALRRPWSPPVPAPLVRFGAWLMGTQGGLALESFRVAPKRLLDAGFSFEYPHLHDALRDLYGSETRLAA